MGKSEVQNFCHPNKDPISLDPFSVLRTPYGGERHDYGGENGFVGRDVK